MITRTLVRCTTRQHPFLALLVLYNSNLYQTPQPRTTCGLPGVFQVLSPKVRLCSHLKRWFWREACAAHPVVRRGLLSITTDHPVPVFKKQVSILALYIKNRNLRPMVDYKHKHLALSEKRTSYFAIYKEQKLQRNKHNFLKRICRCYLFFLRIDTERIVTIH